MDQEQIDKIAEEFVTLKGVTEAGVTPPKGVDAKSAFAKYVTREIDTGIKKQDGTTYKNNMSSSSQDLANALIMNGKDSMEVRVTRFEREMQRPGGPKGERLEKALYVTDGPADPVTGLTLKERLHSPDPKVKEAAQKEADAQQAKFKEEYAKKYPGKEAEKSIDALTSKDAAHKGMYKDMLKDGYNSPKVAAQQISLATNGAGTDEDAIKRSLQGMSPADIKQLKEEYKTTPGGGDLETALGVNGKGGFFTELSGQDRMDVEIMLMGDEKHMNDDERFALAEKKRDQQVGSESTAVGRFVMGGTYEKAAIDKSFNELSEFRANNKSKFVDGKFKGDPAEYEEYLAMCRKVGITAELYQEQSDRIADGITTGIAVVGAIAATVVTGGAAAAVIAGLSGAASMGTNYAMKGGRYGWEEGVKDIGMTGVNMALAYTGGVLDPKKLQGKVAWEATSGFISGTAETAMNDKTWDKGFVDGLGESVYSGFKGATVAAVSTGVSEGLGKIPAIDAMKESTNINRGIGNAITDGVGGMAGKSTEIGIDVSFGKKEFDGSNFIEEVGKEGGKSSMQGFLNGMAEIPGAKKEKAAADKKAAEDAKAEAEKKAAEEQKKIDDASKETETLAKDTKIVKDGEESLNTDKVDAAEKKADDLIDLQEQADKTVTEQGEKVKKAEEKKAAAEEAVHEEQKKVTQDEAVKDDKEVQQHETTEEQDLKKQVAKEELGDDKLVVPNDLSSEELSELMRRVKAGEDKEKLIKEIVSKRDANTSEVKDPETKKVLSEDDALAQLIALKDKGHLSPTDEKAFFSITDPQRREKFLEYLHQRSAEGPEHHERYPEALKQAQAETDPTKQDAKVEEVIAGFDKSGQKAAVEALRKLAPDTQAQLQLAHDLAVFHTIIDKPTAQITDSELKSLVNAHQALMQSTGGEDVILRKFVSDGAAQGMMAKKDQKQTISGCVGDKKNTDGLTGAEAIKALGLDYDDKTFVNSNGDGTFSAKEDAFFIEFTATKEIKAKAQITVTEDLYSRIAELAKSDPKAAELMTRLKPHGGAEGGTGGANPYTGTGGTAAGDRLGKGEGATINQEMHIGGTWDDTTKKMRDVPVLPDGTKMYKLGADGKPVLWATYQADADGKGNWIPSDEAMKTKTKA